MEEKEISEKESYLLIRQMINTAKEEQKDDGKGWIGWGWMIFTASILTIINMRMDWFNTFFFWNVIGILALLFLAWEVIIFFFGRKKEKVRTYTMDLFEKLNIGFFISLFFIIMGINTGISPMHGFPLLINLYAFWILIYGSALNFKPSIYGAFLSWAIGLGSFFAGSFEMVMLFHAIAVLVGYIIPGHIANSEFRKTSRRDKVIESV